MLQPLQRSPRSIAVFGEHPQTGNPSTGGEPLLQGVCDPLGSSRCLLGLNQLNTVCTGSRLIGCPEPQPDHSQLEMTLVVILRSSERLADWDSMKRCEATSKPAANTTTKPAVANSVTSFISPTPQYLGKRPVEGGVPQKVGKSGNCPARRGNSWRHTHCSEQAMQQPKMEPAVS